MQARTTAVSASDRRGGDLIGVDDVVARDLVAFERTACPLWTLPARSSTWRRPLHRDRAAPKSLALFVAGDETHDLRFALHLPDDLADLILRQLGLGQTDAIELATHIQRSL